MLLNDQVFFVPIIGIAIYGISSQFTPYYHQLILNLIDIICKTVNILKAALFSGKKRSKYKYHKYIYLHHTLSYMALDITQTSLIAQLY